MRESNVVRFRVMPGREQKHIVARRDVRGGLAGIRDLGGVGVTGPVSGGIVAELPLGC